MAWGYGGSSDWGFRPYVPVAERQAKARKQIAKRLAKAGREPAPVVADRGREVAKTFWGKAWCQNLEQYGDFANRLPRGRTYVRNGSVLDLHITPGQVTALVAGSELYTVTIALSRLAAPRWRALIKACAGRIGSLIGLLRGELSKDVIETLIRPADGLFPTPAEIEMTCSCPDWAAMCKHLAATLYGVGVRLDTQPELFFTLRQVDQQELLGADAAGALTRRRAGSGKRRLAASSLSSVFGIELDSAPTPRRPRAKKK
jgi:uncharacterized Zn finger protein